MPPVRASSVGAPLLNAQISSANVTTAQSGMQTRRIAQRVPSTISPRDHHLTHAARGTNVSPNMPAAPTAPIGRRR